MNYLHGVKWLSIPLVIGLLLLPVVVVSAPLARPSQEPVSTPANTSILLFIENAGQFHPDARFQVRGANGGVLWLAEDALWVVKSAVSLRLSFPGANPSTGSGQRPHPRLEPFDRLETVVNYYHGNDPAHWCTDVPVWGGVRYVDLYPGVDLEITGQDNRWTWRLVAKTPSPALPLPGGGSEGGGVRLRVEGADDVTLDGATLRLSTAVGDLALPLPAAPDTALSGQATVQHTAPETFDVTSPFAAPATPHASRLTNHALQDNPDHLLFSTFLGGDNNDKGGPLAVDDDGAMYMAGRTATPTFPTTPGAHDTTLTGNEDIFVTKLNAAGSDLVYSTFIGGDETIYEYPKVEGAHDIAVDSSGVAYLSGGTTAADFPTTPGAYDSTGTGFDNILVKLDSSGGLAYSTHLPGTTGNMSAIAVDGAGMIYVTGTTGDPDFPTTDGAYDRTFGYSTDVFLSKLNPAGQGQNDLLYSTYLGGIYHDYVTEIVVDGEGVVHAVGTSSGDFPTTAGAYDTTFNGTLPPGGVPSPTNVVFFKLDPAGNGAADMLYSTYLGGTATINEGGNGIAVDAAGMVYLTGDTWADDFPTTPGAFDTTYNGYGDAFVSKLNPAGNGAADLIYSTYLGGWWIDGGGHGIAVDGDGEIYILGETYSDDFPVTPGAYQSERQGYTDVVVTRLRPQGAGEADLIYSTFLGGSYLDYGGDLVVRGEHTVYVAGRTASDDFPTTEGAYDTTFGGGTCGSYPCDDAFVAKLQVKPSYIITGTVVDTGGQPILGVRVSAGGTYQGTTDTGGRYTITDLAPGAYTLTPSRSGYFFSPGTRTVTIPPSASGQDFVGLHIVKESAIPPWQAVSYGDAVTYTVRLVYPNDRTRVLYDPVPTYTAYISGSLSAPSDVAYDPVADAISGTLSLTATLPTTVSFSVQVEITGTADFAPLILNRACVHPVDGGLADCEWSNEVWNFTCVWPIYLPLVLR